MTLPRMVRVLWVDCQSDAWGWTPVADLEREPCVVTTVGTLIEPAPRPGHVTVALSWHGGNGREVVCDSVVHIPERCIVLIENLYTDAQKAT